MNKSNGTTALVPAPEAPLPMVNNERRELLRDAIMRGATDVQMEMIVQIANRYDMDPLLGHLCLIDGKVFVTHKGLLHAAHNSGQLDGIDTRNGCDELGTYCECAVYRKDMSRPITGRVYEHEYNKKRGAWSSYPLAMLAKTAESFVLRRAFDVSLTSQEEMGQFEEVVEQAPATDFPPQRIYTDEEKTLIREINAGITSLDGEYREKALKIRRAYGVGSVNDMTLEMLQPFKASVIMLMEKQAEERGAADTAEAVIEAEVKDHSEPGPFADAMYCDCGEEIDERRLQECEEKGIIPPTCDNCANKLLDVPAGEKKQEGPNGFQDTAKSGKRGR